MEFKRLFAHKTKPYIILECIDNTEDKKVYLNYKGTEIQEFENGFLEENYEEINNKIIVVTLLAEHLKAISILWEEAKNIDGWDEYKDNILRAMVSIPSLRDIFEF